MKSVQVKVEETSGIKYTVKLNLGGDFTKEEILADKDNLVNYIKKEYPKAQTVDIPIPIKQTRFTNTQISEVGISEASGWGAEYTGHTCYEDFVEFRAIECGERFSFSMTYDEIAQALQ